MLTTLHHVKFEQVIRLGLESGLLIGVFKCGQIKTLHKSCTSGTGAHVHECIHMCHMHIYNKQWTVGNMKKGIYFCWTGLSDLAIHCLLNFFISERLQSSIWSRLFYMVPGNKTLSLSARQNLRIAQHCMELSGSACTKQPFLSESFANNCCLLWESSCPNKRLFLSRRLFLSEKPTTNWWDPKGIASCLGGQLATTLHQNASNVSKTNQKHKCSKSCVRFPWAVPDTGYQ